MGEITNSQPAETPTGLLFKVQRISLLQAKYVARTFKMTVCGHKSVVIAINLTPRPFDSPDLTGCKCYNDGLLWVTAIIE